MKTFIYPEIHLSSEKRKTCHLLKNRETGEYVYVADYFIDYYKFDENNVGHFDNKSFTKVKDVYEMRNSHTDKTIDMLSKIIYNECEEAILPVLYEPLVIVNDNEIAQTNSFELSRNYDYFYDFENVDYFEANGERIPSTFFTKDLPWVPSLGWFTKLVVYRLDQSKPVKYKAVMNSDIKKLREKYEGNYTERGEIKLI